MSHNTGNFVHELVIMAKAFEELPTIKLALEQSEAARSTQLEVIQELQLRIIDYKNKLDEAKANTRKVEAERDDLELRFLEADDKIAGFTRLIKDQAKAFGLLLEAVEPKAEPEPVSTGPDLTKIEEHKFDDGGPYNEPITQPTGQHWSAEDEANHQRAVDPTPVTADGGDGTSGQSDVGEQGHSDPVMNAPSQSPVETSDHTASAEGVSVPADPIASSTAGDGHSHVNVSPTLDANHPADVSSQEPVQTAPSGEHHDDDVGYHNEPNISTEPGGWQAWDSWCTRMNRRYGGGSWPARSSLPTGI